MIVIKEIENPKNVTNGDMLKTIFPNDLWLHIYARRAKKEWWNTPYEDLDGKERNI